MIQGNAPVSHGLYSPCRGDVVFDGSNMIALEAVGDDGSGRVPDGGQSAHFSR